MARRLAARNGGRAGLAALIAILLLGLGLRLDGAWQGRAPVYDATAYAAIAANLDRGHGFTVGPSATQPSSNYSPGLPLVVAGVYELSGGVHERLARLLLAAIGSLAVLFTYLIARRITRSQDSPRQNSEEKGGNVIPALLAAGAVAIYPAFLEYQGMLMSEPLAATLLSGAVLAVLWARDPRQATPARGSCRGERGALRAGSSSTPLSPRHPRVRWLVPGALLGGLVLTRPEYLAVALLVAIVVLLGEERRTWRQGLAQAGALLAGVVLIVAPWTVRNAVALERFVPVSTGGGQVLFAGTYLPSDGDPERVGAEIVASHPELFAPQAVERLRLEQILARLAAHRFPGMNTDQALSRMGREQLWDDVSEEPLEYAGFVVTKVGRIWSHGPREVMREPLWEALHWALVAFGLLGLAVLAWRRRWETLLLGTILLSITAISALLVASPRRVLVMLPLVAALAGVGALLTWDRARRFQRLRGLGPYGGQNSATAGRDSLGRP